MKKWLVLAFLLYLAAVLIAADADASAVERQIERGLRLSSWRSEVSFVGGIPEDDPACRPEMALRLFSNGEEIHAGGRYYYQVVWSSVGTCDLTDVVVTDVLPYLFLGGAPRPVVEVTWVAPEPTSADRYHLTWEIGDAESQGAGSMLIEVVVYDFVRPGDVLIDTACVESAQTEALCQETSSVVAE